MKQHKCAICKIDLNAANANPTVLRKGGYCRKCIKEYHRNKYGGVRKAKGIGGWEYSPCTKCGNRAKSAICYRCVNASRPKKQHVATAPLYEPTDHLPPKRRLKMIEACRKRDGNNCKKCGEPMDDHSVTVDRILPGAHGGMYELSNCQLMHVRCNASKSDSVEETTTSSAHQMRFF